MGYWLDVAPISALLYDICGICDGLSGRALRKLPVLGMIKAQVLPVLLLLCFLTSWV